MAELTLESLAKRVEQLEKQARKSDAKPTKDWRRTVGMFAGSEIAEDINCEVEKMREADRIAGRNRPEGEDASRL